MVIPSGDWLIQSLNQDSAIEVDVRQLALSNKKSTIKVLHVDDDPSALEILKLILVDIDDRFDIDTASTVDEGFTRLEVGKYDVVVSDYEMPRKDGLKFLAALRQQNNKIPFILFTGKGREEVVIKALNLGADGYINKQGTPETVYGELAHSITQNVNRRKNEELLRETETRFHSLFSTMNEGFCLHELIFDDYGKAVDYVILDINTAGESILGLKRNEIIGKRASEVYGSNEAPYIEIYAKVAQNKEPAFFETYFPPLKKDFSISVFSSEKDKFATVFTDITERKQYEEALRLSEEKFRKLFDMAPFGVALFNLKKHVYVDCNSSFEKLCRYSREEIIGRDQVTKLPASELEKFIQKLLKEGYVEIKGGVELVTKFGETRLVEGYFTLVNINGEAHSISNLIDVTERKKAEDALKSR